MRTLSPVIILAALFGGSLFASESYVVVRLIDPAAKNVITATGAIPVNHPDVREDEVLVFATDEQRIRIQNEPNVAFLYPASSELIAGVPVHACSPPKSDLIGEYILNVGLGWNPGGRLPAKLTYSVQSLTWKLGKERTMDALEQALAEWSKYVQVDFSYTDVYSARRNLNILFASGAHGDPFPFDGPGKTLAHTFYPAGVNPEPIAGDLHFDEDENWASGVDPDIQSVILHEIGHALGLGHSDTPTAVMYPYYRRLTNLLPDDIAAIRRLYPERNAEAPAEPGAPDNPESQQPTLLPDTSSEATSEKPSERPSDKTAPTLRVTSPATTILSTAAATARISGTATDSGGVAKITWTASGGRSGVANGTTTWTIPDFALRPGDNSIAIRAYDEAGNMSWRTLTITRR